MTIEAALDVQIEQVSGPPVTDPTHVIAWICADGAWIEGGTNQIWFDVCPAHPVPDECTEDCDAETVVFRALVASADLAK